MSKQKKTRKSKVKRRDSTLDDDKSYTDFLCPICLEILIEPVQMPCKHELCMKCFRKHVEDTSLTCPMCRLRISIWVRKNTKTNTLINLERWDLIQALYPERVKRRLEGLDDIEEEYFAPKHVIAADGEVRKEFEEQMKKIEEEQEAISQVNLEYIQKLQQEELLGRRKQEEIDLAAAKELQKEEMANLGVTLKSPSQHQKELLALLKPKSPMKLRQRSVPDKQTFSSKSKTQRNILTSPNHTITSFFKKITGSDGNTDGKTLDGHASSSSSSSSSINRDHEIARKLQKEYDSHWEQGKSQPLRARNCNNIINPKLPVKRVVIDVDKEVIFPKMRKI